MSNNARIHIENFGPISEANMNITPLTIFIGPNSSGKSFSALLTYVLSNPLDDEILQLKNPIGLGFDSLNSLNQNNHNEFMKFKTNFLSYLDSHPDFSSTPFKISKEDFNSLINNGIGKQYESIIEKKLKLIFQVENLDKLIRLKSDSFKISFNNFYFNNQRKNFEIVNFFENYKNNENIQQSSLPWGGPFFTLKFDNENNILLNLNPIIFSDGIQVKNEDIPEFLYSIISRNFFRDISQKNSYYIPAARDELTKDMNRIIAKNLKGQYNFSKTQSDLVSNILNINSEATGDFYDLACNLEKDIIGAIIDIEDNGPVTKISFRDENNGFTLPLNLVSSSVRELTPLILNLKYILKHGDTLIIEEPEAHLHPENQRILVKYFVEAINQGLKIIITTHSEYLMEQFNNLIRLGNVNEESLKNDFKEYAKIDILKPEDVSIYHFKRKGSYNFVPKEIPVNNTGFDEDNFSKVTEDLYGESIKIIESKRE